MPLDMTVTSAIILAFLSVCYRCFQCVGLPLGRVASPLEWDMPPELTPPGVNITDLEVPLTYCAQQYPLNTSPAPFYGHNQANKLWITTWLIPSIVLATYALILLFLICLKGIQVCCISCMSEDALISGIPNIGNTCYMNAVLQVLCWTPNFRDQLQETTNLIDERNHKTRNEALGEVSATNENRVARPRIDKSLLRLIDRVRASKKVDRSYPEAILDAVRKLNDRFEGHHQQDSYELFNTVIAGLEELIEERFNCDNQTEQLMNASPVSRLLGGVFVNVFTYSSCSHIETKFQRFTSLPVQIRAETKMENIESLPSSNHGSASEHVVDHPDHTDVPCLQTLENKSQGQTDLETGLKLYTEIEESSGDDFCRTCAKAGKKESSTTTRRRRMLISLPPILVLQFNRFKLDGYGRLRKVNGSLSYPKDLDVSPFCSSAIDKLDHGHQSTKYRLYGVVCHAGSINGGHYTAHVRTPIQEHEMDLKTRFLTQNWRNPEKDLEKIMSFWEGKQCDKGERERPDNAESDIWYTISDTYVTNCSQSNALQDSDAYLLMYERL